MNDTEELIKRLRSSAESIPPELYNWLNPLLNEAADEIARLDLACETYYYSAMEGR
jgi:hypothetical protein